MPHATAAPESTIESIMNHHYEPPPGGKVTIPYINSAGSKRIKHTPQRFLKYPGPVGTKRESFADEATIKDVIFKEAQELIKNTTGATNVYAMSHLLRKDPALSVLDIPDDVPDEAEYRSSNVPAMQAANCRWGVINVWKPLKTVTRQPLAVCDATTVPESDLVGFPLRARPDVSPEKKERDVEIWHVMANPEHKWYWPSAMEPDEALLIKCFDSKLDGRAGWAPHSVFNLPNDQGAPRESIEIRCVVLWEDQPKE
ncbi:hypothetical protein BST61_g2397 [Cercospora zeina]